MRGHDVVSQTGASQRRQEATLTEGRAGMVEENRPTVLENPPWLLLAEDPTIMRVVTQATEAKRATYVHVVEPSLRGAVHILSTLCHDWSVRSTAPQQTQTHTTPSGSFVDLWTKCKRTFVYLLGIASL